MTECTGGPEKLLEHDLPRRYTTYCDPRLNYAQGEGEGGSLWGGGRRRTTTQDDAGEGLCEDER